MSRTLFWYVFRDLLRIFLMTSGALAGIMSFGGLLRPLTEHGLDGSQVSKMLTYFTPAMTTYSFPIAALFAATMVYGRLSADNELTACRAGGISYLSMTAPAWVLGFVVSLISLLFLCFVVPVFTLKVEQVVYSNLAQLVQNQIERTHQIKLDRFNVYAQSARVIPVTRQMEEQLNGERAKKHLGKASGLQCVELTAPMIVQYTKVEPPNNKDPNLTLVIASEFSMAKRAIAFIEQQRDDVQLTVYLEGATRFARNTAGDVASMKMDAEGRLVPKSTTQPTKDKPESDFYVGSTWFGPLDMPSPVKEDPKFMTIDALKAMFAKPETSRRLQDQLVSLEKDEQGSEYLHQLLQSADDEGSFTFTDGSGQRVRLARGELRGDLRRGDNELVFQSVPRPETRQVKLTVTDPLDPSTPKETDEAMEMRVRAVARWDATDPQSVATFDVTVEGFDVVIQTGEEEQAARHKKFSHTFWDVPMPAELVKIRDYNAAHYLKDRRLSARAQKDLGQAQNKLLSKLQSEIHSRASFALSCVVLVLVGCALGMMFRSSNFLSAFAVSFVPAMLCIVLIVTGQQICNHATNSMTVGLAFIWSGNVIVLALALTLLGRLQRT
jgi:lipopolysaccharide export LptBFGC system permease protein LptF